MNMKLMSACLGRDYPQKEALCENMCQVGTSERYCDLITTMLT